jgi:hypothetical protein
MKADDIWFNRLDICKFYMDINKLAVRRRDNTEREITKTTDGNF